jgi:DNA repair exonuclease SbcCD nuclease subunit
MGKLVQVGEVAREVGAAGVLDGGDFFHIKSPGRNAHRTILKVATVHKAYPCPTYGNIGNHDCKYGDYSHLPEQPLGVLFETEVFQRCYDEHEVMLEGDGLTVRVVGIPYHGTEYDWDRFTNIKKGDEDYLVVMAHVLASPKGGTMFEGEDIIKYADLAGLDADVFCFGHWHKDQGVTQLGDKWIVNIGSLSRGALNQDDLTRIPSVAVISFTGQGVDVIQRPLDVAPAGEVFDLDKRARRKVKDMTMGAFVDTIQATLAEGAKKPIEDTIREMPGVPDEVKERGILYWEQQG